MPSNPVAVDYPLRNGSLGIKIWGICNGLVCGSPGGEDCVVLWNPATKEFKKVPTVPIESANESAYPQYALGYGDEIDDFKVVCFVGFQDESFCEVQVYTLKSNSWRRLENIPYELCPGPPEMAQASVNGATHWLASTDSGKHEVIASFDFKDARVQKMQLPSFCSGFDGTRLCSLGGSLCLHGSIDGRTDVWEMKEYGVTESWAKLLTFKQDTIFQSSTQSEPLQFVKNGEVLLGYDTDIQLDLHDIKRGTSRNIKAYAKQVSYYGKYASSSVYVESLLQVAHEDKNYRQLKNSVGIFLLLLIQVSMALKVSVVVSQVSCMRFSFFG